MSLFHVDHSKPQVLGLGSRIVAWCEDHFHWMKQYIFFSYYMRLDCHVGAMAMLILSGSNCCMDSSPTPQKYLSGSPLTLRVTLFLYLFLFRIKGRDTGVGINTGGKPISKPT